MKLKVVLEIEITEECYKAHSEGYATPVTEHDMREYVKAELKFAGERFAGLEVKKVSVVSHLRGNHTRARQNSPNELIKSKFSLDKQSHR